MFATKRLRLAIAALAVTVLGGGAAVAATAASASPAQHNPPLSLNRLNLSGFVVNAKYTLGTNTGNTFQQVYGSGTVLGTPIAGPNVGVKFPTEDYVAVPISGDQVYITWQDPTTRAINSPIKARCWGRRIASSWCSTSPRIDRAWQRRKADA